MSTTCNVPTTDWYGCYDGSWKGLIVDEAFAHPAKFAPGLIVRIVEHGLTAGYWRRGDLIGDPFGGVGLGGVICASRGLRWIGVELESEATGGSPFVELARRNFDRHRATWAQFDDPPPVIVQGDSRRFAEIVGELAGTVTSPPFAQSTQVNRDDPVVGGKARWAGGVDSGARCKNDYAVPGSPGQIAQLVPGQLDAVISSPPYAESVQGDHRETETAEASRAKRHTAGGSLGRSQRHGGYGVSDGQIGALKEGALDGCVTSPPYERSMLCAGYADPVKCREREERHLEKHPELVAVRPRHTEYGQSQGQIGNQGGETYWQAMHAVYTQMHLAMKPGAVAAIVVKDYVKKKARVPLCDDTCRLLKAVGFDVFERTRAWLVKEYRQPGLFGEDCVRRKQRKSFFRRLAEKKGSPPIDWEEVIWARRND